MHGCERLVLVGDQNQLPPVVMSPSALQKGLGVSLFSRLIAGGLSPLLLDQQYRMHPAIASFPSSQFYGGRLLSDHVSPADRPVPPGIDWPNPAVPVLFINVSPFTSTQMKVNETAALQEDILPIGSRAVPHGRKSSPCLRAVASRACLTRRRPRT